MPRGIHKDPERHRNLVLAYYHEHKDEPEFRERRREAKRRYYDRWYRKDQVVEKAQQEQAA